MTITCDVIKVYNLYDYNRDITPQKNNVPFYYQ